MRATKAVGAAVFAALMSVSGTVIGGAVHLEVGPNLVSNPGFEATTTLAGSGWTASGFLFEGFDYFIDTNPGNAHSGNHSFAGGGIGQPGYISQDLATIVGESYSIHVRLANLSGFLSNTLFEIWWDGNLVYSQSGIPGFSYNEIVVDPIATSTLTTLSFGLQHDSFYLNIDDISVRQIPVPAPLALLVLGLGGVGLMRGRQAMS